MRRNAIQFNADSLLEILRVKEPMVSRLFNIYGIGAAEWQSVEQCFRIPEYGFRIGTPLNNSLAFTYTVFIDGKIRARAAPNLVLFLIGMVQVHGGIMPESEM